jgi:hypothetical protein
MTKRFFIYALSAIGLLCPLALQAKVYFIKKGIKYHIGDNRFDLSEDKDFLDAFPVVGQEWIQPFTVSEADTVKVHIEKIWGVDDCPYCKVFVSIDDHDMLRLSQANNGQPVDTLKVLAQTLAPGRTHYLKIASYGTTKVDDFMIQDVSVETDVAEVTLLPGPVISDPVGPTPEPTFAVPNTPCESAAPKGGWIPGEAAGKISFELRSKDRNAAESGPLGGLSPGEALEFFVQVDSMPLDTDAVAHALEFSFQKKDGGRDAWVLTLRPAQGGALHGNMIRGGAYRSERFSFNYQANAWNRLRIQSCSDGLLHLAVNGREVNTAIPSGLRPMDFTLRALGLRVTVSKLAQAAAAAPELLPTPGGL